MWTKLIAAGVLTAMFGVAPATAQESSDSLPLPSANQSDEAVNPEMVDEMVDLTGWPVYASDGEELGEVKRVKRAAGGKPEAIHVNMGGFLGIGETTHEISAEKFTVGDERIDLAITADEASALPEVETQ